MAQLSGVMTADFSDFMFEIDKSVVKLKDLEGASAHTSGAIGEFSEGLGTADKTLNLLGIRIGPQIQALKELGGAAGKTASEIGLIGTVGLTVGAAVGGWQVGTWIANVTGLGDAIAETTAKLLGFGDAAAERTGAKMDVLNRAAQIAGRTVLDFDEALQIIKRHNQETAESFNTGAIRVEQWNREIAKVTASGNLPAIQTELKNHSSTLTEISTHYGISVRALEHYIRTLGDSTKAQKAWADEARPRYEAIRLAQEELNQAGEGWRATLATLTPAVAAAVTQHLALGQSQITIATAYSLSKVQVDAVNRAYLEQTAALAALEPKTQSLDTWMRTVGTQFQVAAESGEQFKTMLELTGGAVETLVPKVEKLDTVFRSVTEAAKVTPGMDQKAPGASVPIDIGEINYGTMGFAKVFEEYTKKAGAGGGALGGFIGGGPPKDFLTWALSMGLATRGPTVTNTFNIVDTESGIARRVGDTITSQVQRGTLVN